MATRRVNVITLGHVLIRARQIPKTAAVRSLEIKPNGRIIINTEIDTPGGIEQKEYSLVDLSAPDLKEKEVVVNTNEDGVTKIE